MEGQIGSRVTLKEGLTVSYKAEHSPDICPHIVLASIHLTDLKIYVHTNLYENVCSSFIHNHPEPLATNLS